MKTILLNGSPRKNWNTAMMLKEARKGAESVGAETEYIDLFDLTYTGCRSCMACKRKGAERCKCFWKDDLSPLLDRVFAADVLLIGSPGAGKSMLAKRMVTILPEMTFDETIETTKIHSIAGTLKRGSGLITTRPFRAPHHTITRVGLTGGGTNPKPGEISLAHNGVLFLDELPEFPRSVLEVLRQPLEDGTVSISRAHGTYTYPSRFTLIAAMNPCPCGYFGHPKKQCSCSDTAVHKYLNRVSGPLLDRIDIHIEVPPVEYDDLTSKSGEEKSEDIRRRVDAARDIQLSRFEGTATRCNAHIQPADFERVCVMDDKADRMLKTAFDKLGMTARAYDRIMKVARTIADLDQSEIIRAAHISEAIQYRSLDRKYWHD